ncbi:MAG TPA: helix-hairpin-helix domain-containing protein [Candidatus Acidoferrales bacterium]|nr:helix-hairpin-helix domain-containing protein [Candidatus Acidoferrales bacterium]
MIRKALLVVAVGAILVTAAIVRPPRAAPALSFAPAAQLSQAGETRVGDRGCRGPECHPERSERKRAKSKDRRHRAHQRRSRHRDNVPLHPVDLNRADAATLARIPGVGEWLAQRIVEYRGLVGPFETLDDLSDLDGISATRLASLGRYVVVR